MGFAASDKRPYNRMCLRKQPGVLAWYALLVALLAACRPAANTARITPRPIPELPSPPPTVTAGSAPSAAPSSATPQAGLAAQATPAPTLATTATRRTTETATVTTPRPATPTPGASLQVTLFNYKFAPAEIRVRSGATIRLELRNTDHVLHALTIPDAGFARVVQGGDTAEVDLYVDLLPGSYYLYCPIQEEGNHEDNGMFGALIVEP
jgi:plastocyanin